SEPTRCLDHIHEALARLELVNARPAHGTGYLRARSVHSDEYHVPGLKAEVAARIAAEEVCVEIERCDDLPKAADFDGAQVGAFGDASRRIQCGEHRAERADLIGAGLLTLAH